MLMDIEAGRRTEVDYINGKFVAYGQRAGVSTRSTEPCCHW